MFIRTQCGHLALDSDGAILTMVTDGVILIMDGDTRDGAILAGVTQVGDIQVTDMVITAITPITTEEEDLQHTTVPEDIQQEVHLMPEEIMPEGIILEGIILEGIMPEEMIILPIEITTPTEAVLITQIIEEALLQTEEHTLVLHLPTEEAVLQVKAIAMIILTEDQAAAQQQLIEVTITTQTAVLPEATLLAHHAQ